MAAVDWQAVVDACDQALLDIATTQRPVTVTAAGRTVQLFTADHAIKLRDYAQAQLVRTNSDGDPTSFAVGLGLI